MLAFDVRVQGGLFDGLEAALVAREHLVLHLVPALVRIQGALLRAREVTEVAVNFDVLPTAAPFCHVGRHVSRRLGAIFSANLLLDHKILMRSRQCGYLLSYFAVMRASNWRISLLR